MATNRRHAIVLGGSMAGLAAARALADHFDRVTLVEHDELTMSRGSRKGVPQGQHAHSLWPWARQLGWPPTPRNTEPLTLGPRSVGVRDW